MLLWADALPNLVIGLREGLEAALVVTVLLSALRKVAPTRSPFAIWFGVVGALVLSGSFAAVLTFSAAVLSSAAQEAIGGTLSVVAVGLVTWMVFWMRRTARHLSSDLSAKVADAAGLGAGALAITAFLAVGREGLETTLFLWTAVRASGSTVAPLIGAGIGIALAVLICWLLFRGAVRMNLGVFFSRTATALIVIAAGILAYGLGDLQDSGLLPGHDWVAFDLTGWSQAGSWWVALISGVTELQLRMTVLSAVAWIVYLGVVLPMFWRRTATEAPRAERPASQSSVPAAAHRPLAGLSRRRRRLALGALALVPVCAAVVLIAVIPSRAASATAVEVADGTCGSGWNSGTTGTTVFSVANRSGRSGEVNLDDAAGAVVAELETLGPGTTAEMTATLTAGTYTFRCYLSGAKATSGTPVTVTGERVAAAPAAVVPPTVAELTGPNRAYQQWTSDHLAAVHADLTALARDLPHSAATARADWLRAQMDWEEVGASYDSFGDLGEAVDSLPVQFERGVTDPSFTGLHRVEYDLWHGASRAAIEADVAVTQRAVAAVQKHLTSDDLAGDPTNLPLRAHEIIEDALRDHLAGIDDNGSRAGYALTYADTVVDRTVLQELAPLIASRSPHLVATAEAQLDRLQRSLLALRHSDGAWTDLADATTAQHEQVDADVGALLETLAAVPDLLEVPPSQL